jgi:hypothetical protein
MHPTTIFSQLIIKGGLHSLKKGYLNQAWLASEWHYPLFFLLLLLLSHATHLRWQMCLIRVVLLLCRGLGFIIV